MLSYIILTYILSIGGGLAYWLFLRRKISSSNQKSSLLSIVLLSLIVPLFFIQSTAITPKLLQEEKSIVQKDFYILEESVFIDFCPVGEVLETCYQQAITSDDFCHCENIQKENLLYYQEKPFYNFLTWQETAFWKILAFAGLGIFLTLLANVLYLNRLILKSRKEKRILSGQSYTILYPSKPLSVASFRLLDSYIIWQDEMDFLTKEEQDAILFHEISHIKQFYTWIKIVLNVLNMLWIVNPVYYLIKEDIDRLNEHIADEFAVKKVGNAKAYASLLFKMKTAQQASLTQGFKNHSSFFKERIKHILSDKPQKDRLLLNIVNIAFIILCFVITSQKTYPLIDKQIDKLKIYQKLSKHNIETGKTTFCKLCLQEELEEACRE